MPQDAQARRVVARMLNTKDMSLYSDPRMLDLTYFVKMCCVGSKRLCLGLHKVPTSDFFQMRLRSGIGAYGTTIYLTPK